MGKLAATLYGAFCYAFFFIVFLYAIGFVEGIYVPKTIDSGPADAMPVALAVNLALLGLFAVQHSVMARQEFKRWWTKFVPWPIERSTYVLFASAALTLLFVYWRPMPSVVWSVGAPWNIVLWAISGLGWATVLLSTFLINHFDLFGLRQVWAYRSGRKIPPPEFHEPLFYRVVRHPLYLGFIMAFWAAPVMTVGHLVFALATTIYILVAIQLEERDLVTLFGDTYRDYQKRVSMILPWFPGKPATPSSPTRKPVKG
jgi:protein-S-isoprenylcysteine O-methyltransferase Ste14